LQKTRLWKSLLTLKATERSAFRKFLASPYFNKREDVQLLFDYLDRQMERQRIPKTEEIVGSYLSWSGC
jgi:hypothetical protein